MQSHILVLSLLSIFSWSLQAEQSAVQAKSELSEAIPISQNESDDSAKVLKITEFMLAGFALPSCLVELDDLDYIVSFLTIYKAIAEIDLKACKQEVLNLKGLTSAHKAFLLEQANWNIQTMLSRFDRRARFKSVAIAKKNEQLSAAIENAEQREEFKSFLAFGTIMACSLAGIVYAPKYIGHENMVYIICGGPCSLVGLIVAKALGVFSDGKWEQTMAGDVKDIQNEALEIRSFIESLETAS